MTLRFLTAGESHGPGLVGIVEGLPAGLAVRPANIDADLARRQIGLGRSARMEIEHDQVEILSGVVAGLTIGSPVALTIKNLDYANWQGKQVAQQTVPRPGHADLAGGMKYGLEDLRLVGERASARETAMRVACGSLARLLLAEFAVEVGSHVLEIGGVTADLPDLPWADLVGRARASDLAVADPDSAERIAARIREAMAAGDTLGGVIEVVAWNVPAGLGSHVHWDRRLDGRLAQAVMSVQSVKGVEIGPAFANTRLPGSQVQDEVLPGSGTGETTRASNRAGGMEGGISNGMPVVVRAALKPIATTLQPLRSVDLATGKPTRSRYQRSDYCHVPRACVVAEAMVAWVLAEALLEKLGGDSLAEMRAHRRAAR
jgi:chorismate synthase